VLTVLLASAEPSKVPFYIAGGLLAVWAVAVSAVGFNRPSFPFGAAGQRAVMGVSIVLAVLAVAMAIATDP
jgi:hypothetical protein